MGTGDGDERRQPGDVEPQPSPPPKPLASWYAQGLSDGIGDRLLMFDNSGAPSLELLRFHPHLAQTPGFETALRERVERLGDFRHPAFAQVRSVKHLDPDDDLALVSNCTPGKRLSEVLHRAHGPAFAAALIRQLAPALVLLQQHEAGGSHGALSPDRIVVSPEGRLTIVEHVLGPALDALHLRNTQLGSLGIAVPPTALSARPHLNVATDWYQLGLVAVATLLGRPVTSNDLQQVETLLERAAHPGADGVALSPAIRQWLDRALQISGTRIESGADARAALDELLHKDARPHGPRRIRRAPAADSDPADSAASPVALPLTSAAREDTDAAAALPAAALPAPDLGTHAPEAQSALEQWPTEAAQTPVEVRTLLGEQPVAAKRSYAPAVAEAAFHYPAPEAKVQAAAVRRWKISVPVVVLALIAGVEAGVIARLSRALWLAPQPAIIVDPTLSADGGVPLRSRSSEAGPLQLTVAPDLRWVRVTSPASAPNAGGKATTVPTGTVRITSPIELKVMEGSKELGSVPGSGLNLPAGRHDIELVNAALGYRSRQILEVVAGQSVSIHVTPAPGSVTIDASPWADVSIDGQPIGRTPLGPLALSAGEHLVIFQHPAGGSDRQRVTVKSQEKMRVVGVLRR